MPTKTNGRTASKTNGKPSRNGHTGRKGARKEKDVVRPDVVTNPPRKDDQAEDDELLDGSFHRPTAKEFEDRVGFVLEMMLNGVRRHGILQAVATEHPDWRLCVRTVDNYIARAKEAIREEGRRRKSVEFGKALGRYEDIYRRAVTQRALHAQVAANQGMVNLLGLDPARRIEMTGKDGGAIEVAPVQWMEWGGRKIVF